MTLDNDFDFDDLDDVAPPVVSTGNSKPMVVPEGIDLDAILGAPLKVTPSKALVPKVLVHPAPRVSTGASVGAPSADAFDAFMQDTGLKQQSGVEGDFFKPWMKYHTFTLVRTVAEVREIVNAAIKHGRCALDLETQGLDNRIDYDAAGQPSTKHKIVGYCLSVRGAGYYIPVRHSHNPTFGDRNPNVDVAGVEAEIRRLCWAAQPEVSEAERADNPFAGKPVKPGELVIYFWNAKFDQEFLYPVIGLDVWHPDSFEDGMLSAYVYFTDDKDLGLKAKAKERLRITDPDVKGLDGVPIMHPYEMIEFKDLFPKGAKSSDLRFADLHPDDGMQVVLYGCSDAICTEILCESKRISWAHTKEGLITNYSDVIGPTKADPHLWSTYRRIEKQTIAAVREMERVRTQIHLPKTKQLLEEAKAELLEYEEKIKKLAKSKGFDDLNPGSGEQLSDFLFGAAGLNISPKPELTSPGSKQYKTDADTLESLFETHPEVEVLEWVVKHRQIVKVIGTYLEGLSSNCDERGQLRFNFKQHGAATGRFTAPAGKPDQGFSGIPIHGIPARDDPTKPKAAQALRRLFVSRPGYTMVKVDYAGQELRVVANISGEPLWIKEFLEGDGDLHTLTAQAFYPGLQKSDPDFKIKRTAGKIANFSLIYGGGVQAIQRATKCDKVEAARKLKAFHQSVPRFATWMKQQHASVKTKLGVYTGFQRFIRIPDANVTPGSDLNGKPITDEDSKRIRAACERKATNYPIQGSGADILKISLIKLHKELTKRGWLRSGGGDDSVRMIMTVHDEIDFEVKHERLMEAMPVIVHCMEFPSQIKPDWKIPLIVEPDIGLDWEAKYSWPHIMSGKSPVPHWLEGIVQPGADRALAVVSPSPIQQLPAATNTTAINNMQETDPDEAPVTSKSRVTRSEGERREIVTFVVPQARITTGIVANIMGAISSSMRVPNLETGTLLRLMNEDSEVLIDPDEMGLRVDPVIFSIRLRDLSLGPGTYEITNETS